MAALETNTVSKEDSDRRNQKEPKGETLWAEGTDEVKTIHIIWKLTQSGVTKEQNTCCINKGRKTHNELTFLPYGWDWQSHGGLSKRRVRKDESGAELKAKKV